MKNSRTKFWPALLLMLCVGTQAAAQLDVVTLPAGLQPAPASEMIVFSNDLYMVLQNDAHDTFYLYRYNGVTFVHVPLPTGYKLYRDTEFEELNSKIYFMPDHADTDATAEILEFNGASFNIIHIPESVMPRDSLHLWGHRPFVYNGKLHIEAAYDEYHPLESEYRYSPFWVMYDGATFTKRRVGVPQMTFAPFGSTQPASDKIRYDGRLFTRYYDYLTGRHQILEYGTRITPSRTHINIIAYPGQGEMAEFHHLFYIPVTTDASPPNSPATKLNRFDGLTQTELPLLAGLSLANSSLEVYNDKLWAAMNDGSTVPQLYSFNGSSFAHTPIHGGVNITPEGEFRTYGCKMYFCGSGSDVIGDKLVYKLYTLEDGSLCHQPVWPPLLDRFDEIKINIYTVDNDWCWTNLGIKWPVVVPCKLPDCIDPLFRVNVGTDANNIVWSKDFKEPFDAAFQINDQKPYVTTLALGNEKDGLADVVVLDKELVPAGITGVSLNINTQKKTFNITAEALKGKKIPFTAALLDAKGNILWKQELTAPVSTAITATTSQRGATLRFMYDKGVQATAKTSVAVYPNPSPNQVQITVDTDETKTPARIRITNAQGNVVYDKTVTTPATERPSTLAPGIYIVRVTIGKEEHTSRLVVKPGL